MKAPDLTLPFYIRLQRLFYIIPPNESSFKTLDEVPNYVVESSSAFQVLIFVELIILWLQCKPMPRVQDVINSVGAGIFSYLPRLLIKRAIEIVAYCYVWDNYRIYELPWDSTWTWIAALLAVDLGYYWVHRCAHEVNFMWAAHQMHHSSEDYNLSTALRQSLLQSYSSWIFYLPFALFIPPPMYQVHTQFNLLYQFWIHTEVIGWLGPLEYIINTPSAHRVHHGRNRYCIDKNYAGTFTFFDIIFGTYERERRDNLKEKVVYGLVHPLQSSNPIYAQFCHWQYIIQTAWQRKGVANKIKTFIYGPGWEPGKPRMGHITDIPDIQYPQPKYEVDTPAWFSVYSILHFIPVFAIHSVAHDYLDSFSQLHIMLSISFILFSLTCIGSLYDRRSYGPVMELTRCVVVSAFLLTRVELFDKFTFPLLVLFTASALVQCLLLYKQASGSMGSKGRIGSEGTVKSAYLQNGKSSVEINGQNKKSNGKLD